MLSKNEEAVIYILKKMGNLPKTMLVKLLYILDKKSLEQRGKTITSFRYVRYFYGPYTKEIDKIIDSLNIGEYISFVRYITSTYREVYLLGLDQRGEKFTFKELTEEEREFMDKVLQEYKNKNLEDVLDEVYSFDEVKSANFGEEIKLR